MTPHSCAHGASIVSAVLLVGAGAIWLVAPATAAGLLGIPLEGRSFPAYGVLKGMEDIVPAVLILLFVKQRNADALATTLLVSLLVPAVDIGLVFAVNGLTPALLMHTPYVVFPLVGAWFLRRATG